MQQNSVKALFAYLVNTLHFDEEKLKAFGHEMGRIMLMVSKFEKEEQIEGLLYKLVFSYLPQFYTSKRYLERKTGEEQTYLLIEPKGYFTEGVDVPENETFCCESVIAGALEMIIEASGFNSEVTAHNQFTNKDKYKIIYEIKIF